MLDERLEFFVPKLLGIMKAWQWLLYIFFWSLFVTILEVKDLATWSDFFIMFMSRAIQNTLTIIPSIYLIDYLRPVLKRMSVTKVSMSIMSLLIISSAVTMMLVMLVMINMGWMEYQRQSFVLDVLFDCFTGGAFTLVFLLYFLRRHREYNSLRRSFDKKLTAQNDFIKARITPHFFFNTINTLVALIETNPPRAAELLQNVSALFRASFNGAREISFEEEVALCERYLSIESSRLADKLVVYWQLPNEDIMYDMVITSLTLQSVLEKMLINVVEMTTETIYIDIGVTWKNHQVCILVSVKLPSKTLMINYDLRQHMNFDIQAERLKSYFGKNASIQSNVTSKHIITTIEYTLHDVAL